MNPTASPDSTETVGFDEHSALTPVVQFDYEAVDRALSPDQLNRLMEEAVKIAEDRKAAEALRRVFEWVFEPHTLMRGLDRQMHASLVRALTVGFYALPSTFPGLSLEKIAARYEVSKSAISKCRRTMSTIFDFKTPRTFGEGHREAIRRAKLGGGTGGGNSTTPE